MTSDLFIAGAAAWFQTFSGAGKAKSTHLSRLDQPALCSLWELKISYVNRWDHGQFAYDLMEDLTLHPFVAETSRIFLRLRRQDTTCT